MKGERGNRIKNCTDGGLLFEIVLIFEFGLRRRCSWRVALGLRRLPVECLISQICGGGSELGVDFCMAVRQRAARHQSSGAENWYRPGPRVHYDIVKSTIGSDVPSRDLGDPLP